MMEWGKILLSAAVFAADQTGKVMSRTSWSKRNRTVGRKPISVTLCYSRNKGAFLNLGEKRPAVIQMISVGLTVILTLVFILTLGSGKAPSENRSVASSRRGLQQYV